MYIGKTNRSFNKRLNEHLSRSNPSDGTAIHNAIAKYGIKNFTINIIEEFIDNDDDLNKLEQYYIQQYNTIAPNGYNITIGGDGRTLFSYEKINDLWDLKYTVAEICKIMSCSKKVVQSALETNPTYNKHNSLSRSQKYRRNTEKQTKPKEKSPIKTDYCTAPKQIGQYTKNGELIKIYNSYQEAARYIKTAEQNENVVANSIGRVCRGGRPTAYGYLWKLINWREDKKPEECEWSQLQ